MAQGNPAVNYPNWSFPNVLVAGVYYHLKYLDFQKGPYGNNNIGWFPRRLYIYKKKDNRDTPLVDVTKEDIFLPDFYSYDLTYHVNGFVLRFLGSSNLQNLQTPKENLLNDKPLEMINLFSKDIFKLPQETIVKTGVNNYIKKLMVGFVNESYFLYNKKNMIEQTLTTEINTLISVYGSISYFDKKSIKVELVEIAVQIVYFNNPLTF